MSRKSRGYTEPDHDRGSRSLRLRALPFVAPWCLACAVPATGLLTHQAWGDDPVTTPLAALGMAAGTAGLAGLSWLIARKARREAVIRWHTAVTVAVTGAATTGTMIVGLPRPWLDVVLGVGALFAASWNLRRLDALRSEATDRPEEDSWGQVLGMPKTRPGKAVAVGARLEVPLRHGAGETVRNAQQALPAIEAARGIPAGRSRVVPDPDDAGRSRLVLVEHDVLKDTIVWPGPSAPGGCVTQPLRTGVHEDDQPTAFWLPAAPPGAKDSRPPTNVMYMGITRSGKTVAALVNTAEVMSRRNVVVIWADASKGEQTAGPIRSGLELYADTVPKTRVLFKGLKAMVRARADLLGRHGFRQWEPACHTHPELRMPYVMVHLEEADEYIDTEDFVWLCGKALSTGVSMSVSLQRADHSSMPTTARYNIGASFCFGTGDDYSAQFALSEATLAAGANPQVWKASRQGYFYLETPGVDPERYPVPARAYWATDAQIDAAVRHHAPGRAHLDEASRAALGDAHTACQPQPPTTPPARPGTVVAPHTTRAPAPAGSGPDDLDDEIAEELAEMRARAAADVAAEFPRPQDPNLPPETAASAPLPPHNGLDHAFGDGRPDAVSQAQAETAFDAMLRQFALEARADVTVAEMLARYPYRSRSWFSRRLSAVAEGTVVAPPGLVLARTDREGTYDLHHLTDR